MAEHPDQGLAMEGPEGHDYERRRYSESSGQSLKVSEQGEECDQSYFPLSFCTQ